MNIVRSCSTNPWFSALGLLVALVSVSGCYGVTSRHYFAMADLNAPEPDQQLTFYRVTVRASSRFTTSQYNAGFYDAEALHQLFGEVKKPETPAANSGETKKTDAAAPASPGGLRAGALLLDCDAKGHCKVRGGNDRFTVIYGANADAVAEQIRLFADSENTGKQIAALLAATASADVFERTTAADQNSEQLKKHAAALAKQLKSFADEIATAATPDQVRQILLRAAQLASQKAGSSATFDTRDLDRGFVQAEAAYETLRK